MRRDYVYKLLIISILITFMFTGLSGQGFLHTSGKKIVDGNDEEVILRGIGTGNWMLQEGYMMKTAGVAGTQHEFRAKLIETIREEKTDSFYNVWLNNHFTRTDVDSMKAWGFNSVRVAMHYNLFTLPIEEEPVSGENTWLDRGFEMIDSLLDWCSDNKMYLILDLHAAPGGQGKNADISDYDPTKPSLWESQENKDKTVALWRNLAGRYSTEPWMGGYDLINETNWPLGNNASLRDLFEDITTAIREVDTNHIIFIEGNSYANDYTGLTPPWDDNMVYSFHRYNAGTGPGDLDWVLPMRDTYNVPLWLGESGENSNTWFTDLIQLCESKNIGWSWWPVKKSSINAILNVSFNKEYDDLIRYWKGEITTAPTEEEAFQTVLQFAANHKIENCHIQYDVIDAMIRQPHTDDVIPFKDHKMGEPIFFTDYDLGKNTFAYYDSEVAFYGGTWVDWNVKWGYRNDGVDIETCQDPDTTNGYSIGYIDDDEWLQYTFSSDSLAAYTLTVRYSSPYSTGKVLVLNDGTPVKVISLSSTGGWYNWKSITVPGVQLKNGMQSIKMVALKAGFNLNYFMYHDPVSLDSVAFDKVYAESSVDGRSVILTLNKEIVSEPGTVIPSDFEVTSGGNLLAVSGVEVDSLNPGQLILKLQDTIYYGTVTFLDYTGQSILSASQTLPEFSGLIVANNLPVRYNLPGRIQAEGFSVNNGFSLEDCQDSDGGLNTAYANSGDYLDYRVHVTKSGHYRLDFRVATERSNAELMVQVDTGDAFVTLETIRFTSTGGWQNWQTQSVDLFLGQGRYTLRLRVKQGEHNLNWFEMTDITGLEGSAFFREDLKVYPNPARSYVTVEFVQPVNGFRTLELIDSRGIILMKIRTDEDRKVINTDHLTHGIYFLRIIGPGTSDICKLMKN